jgi:hypothetical protein
MKLRGTMMPSALDAAYSEIDVPEPPICAGLAVPCEAADGAPIE